MYPSMIQRVLYTWYSSSSWGKPPSSSSSSSSNLCPSSVSAPAVSDRSV